MQLLPSITICIIFLINLYPLLSWNIVLQSPFDMNYSHPYDLGHFGLFITKAESTVPQQAKTSRILMLHTDNTVL